MTVAARRRYIVRACKQRGWVVQPAALQGMMEYVHSEQALEDLLDGLAGAGMAAQTTLTAEVWEDFAEAERQREEAAGPAAGRARKGHGEPSPAWTDQVQVIGAFRTPRLVYDVTRKQFHVKETQKSLFGTPEDKTNMLAQRYALIHQRLLRHELFRPNQLGHDARTASVQHQLTPIESLLGKKTMSKTFLLLGILVQIEEGKYYLEDPTGQVQVSFQDATAVDDFFVTEHCILLVEGSFHDGTLYIHRIGHPLLEPREVTLAAIQQQLSHPFFGKRIDRGLEEDPSMIVLSDVHLDQPRVLQQLESLFATYEKFAPHQLPLFVLMGNFASTLCDSPPMDELATVLAPFTNLCANAHFVLVPGPNDSAQQVLPLPPIAARLPRVAHAHWTTNPARICYGGREVVLFCYNVLHMLQRKQISLPHEAVAVDSLDPPSPGGSAASPASHRSDVQRLESTRLHCRMIKTLLDQAHLLPLQGVPVFWNYDHALRLYPLPDALVLGGDAVGDGFHEVYGGCQVLHAGSMGASGRYAVYHLRADRPRKEGDGDAMMQDDDDDSIADAGPATVEFARFGNSTD